MNNYNRYWKNWNVSQSAKIDLDLLKEDGWDVFDGMNDLYTVAKRGDTKLRVDFLRTGGVQRIVVSEGDQTKYAQTFNYLLKPTIEQLQKIMENMGIEDWRRYYTAC